MKTERTNQCETKNRKRKSQIKGFIAVTIRMQKEKLELMARSEGQ